MQAPPLERARMNGAALSAAVCLGPLAACTQQYPVIRGNAGAGDSSRPRPRERVAPLCDPRCPKSAERGLKHGCPAWPEHKERTLVSQAVRDLTHDDSRHDPVAMQRTFGGEPCARGFTQLRYLAAAWGVARIVSG